jgi:hypothetical protein
VRRDPADAQGRTASVSSRSARPARLSEILRPEHPNGFEGSGFQGFRGWRPCASCGSYTHDFAGRLRDEAGRGRAIKAQQRRSARTGALLARAPIVSPVAAMRI